MKSALAVLAVLATTTAIAQPHPLKARLDAFAAIAKEDPSHAGAIYTAARTAAAMGDTMAAFSWLGRLEKLGFGDELEPDDFGTLAKTQPFRDRAAKFALAAPPIGKPTSVIELQCADLLPEGTAWDAKRREVLISSGRQRKVVAVSASGACRDVVPPGDGGLYAVLGMHVDAATDSLWVASAGAPFMVPMKPDEAFSTSLSRIDLAKGRVTATYALPVKGMLNDLALAADGTVYVTESRSGTVYRLKPGAKALEAILPPESFESPNGIVVLASGDLLVADFHGLQRVSLGNVPKVTRLSTLDKLYLGGFDGIARSGDRIIGIQNLIGRGRVWSMRLDAEATRVESAEILLRGHPDFLNPTTGVIVGSSFRFIADPKLQEAMPNGALTSLPAGRRGHRLLEVEIGK